MSLLPLIVSAPAELVSRIGGEEEAGRNPRRDAVEQNKDRGGHRAEVPHVEEDAPLGVVVQSPASGESAGTPASTLLRSATGRSQSRKRESMARPKTRVRRVGGTAR